MLGEQIGFSAKGIEAASPQMGTWLATALKEKFGADVGLVNAKGARQALAQGPVKKAAIYDLIPFENSVVVLKVSAGPTTTTIHSNELAPANSGAKLSATS